MTATTPMFIMVGIGHRKCNTYCSESLTDNFRVIDHYKQSHRPLVSRFLGRVGEELSFSQLAVAELLKTE